MIAEIRNKTIVLCERWDEENNMGTDIVGSFSYTAIEDIEYQKDDNRFLVLYRTGAKRSFLYADTVKNMVKGGGA